MHSGRGLLTHVSGIIFRLGHPIAVILPIFSHNKQKQNKPTKQNTERNRKPTGKPHFSSCRSRCRLQGRGEVEHGLEASVLFADLQA